MQSWMFGQAMAEDGSTSLGRKLVAIRSSAVASTGSTGCQWSNAS